MSDLAHGFVIVLGAIGILWPPNAEGEKPMAFMGVVLLFLAAIF